MEGPEGEFQMAEEKSRTKGRKALVDHNAVVKVGAIVEGHFSEKTDHFMVVVFDYQGSMCSGVLHVSQFPHKNRKRRDDMFELAQVGKQRFKFRVIEVVPPRGKFRLTVVRLTAREDFDPEIFARSSIAGSYRGDKK